MKKFIALAVLFISLGLAPLAHAQYTNPNEACNTQYYNGIPQQPLTMVVNVFPQYTIAGTSDDVTKLEAAFIEATNGNIQYQRPGSLLVFTQANEDSFNIKINMMVYASNGQYSVYLEARGLGVGHLFRFSETGSSGSAGDVFVQVAAELSKYFINGWSCGTTSLSTPPSAYIPSARLATLMLTKQEAAAVPNAVVGKWYGLSCDRTSGTVEAVYLAMTVNDDSTAAITELDTPEGNRTAPISGTVLDATSSNIHILFPSGEQGEPSIGLSLESATYENSPALLGEAVLTNSQDSTSITDPIAFIPAAGTLSDFAAKHPVSTCGQ